MARSRDGEGRLAFADAGAGRPSGHSRPGQAAVESAGIRAFPEGDASAETEASRHERIVRPADASTLGQVAPAAIGRDRDG
jgi:hypothetical protein